MTIFTKEDVGKDVKCCVNGNGAISEFVNYESHPVFVRFCNGRKDYYKIDGRMRFNDAMPLLSFGHFEEDHNE